MSWFDRFHLAQTVWRYRFWLEHHDVPLRLRRELTVELEANLLDAAQSVGVRRAVRNLGGVRQLAAAVSGPRSRRPRWGGAAVVAAAAVFVAVAVQLLIAIYLRPADAAVDSTELEGPLGADVTVETFTVTLSWVPAAVVALVVFVAVARPWRLFHRP